MKDQLNKLKDMLEIVKTTENVVQNSNGSQEANELACDVRTKAENFLLNDFQNIKTRPNTQNDSNMLRYDNNTMSDNRQKQVNKNTREQSRCAKSRTSSINELEAKKRELEDLMGKHKGKNTYNIFIYYWLLFLYSWNIEFESWHRCRLKIRV